MRQVRTNDVIGPAGRRGAQHEQPEGGDRGQHEQPAIEPMPGEGDRRHDAPTMRLVSGWRHIAGDVAGASVSDGRRAARATARLRRGQSRSTTLRRALLIFKARLL
jgi:hypothetical protein